eukprot:TRINITY_DN7504_c0_g1_i1.p1 TRINITY_DN7504_c0_g1~~TRINITY_DN7504_c0_g1_i1.p1  ORF type:complete len:440 (-),score=74.60 TRINITY_DN7504_c0_g1_i1:53-1372(-)
MTMSHADKRQRCEQRFIRGNKIGEGAVKTVYDAIDTDNGVDVAWNEMKLNRRNVDLQQLIKEAKLLKKLDHKNILRFVEVWINEEDLKLILITELMIPGNLKNFIFKAGGITLKVFKGYCRQILDGLIYLHTVAKVIHRDIKCDNIFINGSTGMLKIGDLGIATVMKREARTYSVIGTMEYMAPEFYEEKYDNMVDIWAFGMLMIEMATMDSPYSDCENEAQIYRRVSSGILPKELERIKVSDIRDFILECLAIKPEDRPSAQQLRDSPFLLDNPEDSIMNQRLVDETQKESVPTRRLSKVAEIIVTGNHVISCPNPSVEKTPFANPEYFAIANTFESTPAKSHLQEQQLEREQLQKQQQLELRYLQSKVEEEISALSKKHQVETERLDTDYNQKMATLRTRHQRELADLIAQSEAEIQPNSPATSLKELMTSQAENFS